MGNGITPVAVDASEVAGLVGMSENAVACLIAAACDAESVKATLREYHQRSRDDGIAIPPDVDETAIAKLVYVLGEYRSMIARMREGFEAALDCETKHVHDLADERDRLQAEIASLNEKIAGAREHAHKIAAERDEQSRIRAQLQLKYDNEVDDLNVAIEALRATIDTERKQTITNIATIAKERDAARIERDDHLASIKLIEQQRDATQRDYEQLVSAIDQANDDDRGAHDALGQMTEARDELVAKCTEYQDAVASLEAEIAKMRESSSAEAPKNFDKVVLRVQRYRLLVDAVGRRLDDCPPTIKAAYGAAIARG